MKLNRSGKMAALICAGIFGFLFLCNVMTLKIADDFAYCYSWADWSRITKVADIFPSMAAHAQTMNGRLIAHFMAQFFLMFPDWVFDIVNAAVFVAQLALVARIARGEEKRNNLVLVGVFAAMWVFELAFGQANLWLDGACNYLWNIAFGLAFIWPFVKVFLYDDHTYKTWLAVPFAVLSVVAGGYGESGSAAFIFMAMALTVLSCIWQKKKCQVMLVSGLIAAVLGYITIYLAPAEMTKASSFSWAELYQMIRTLVSILVQIWVLPVAFVALLVLNIYNRTEKKRILLAAVFFLGAMCAHFILIFAKGYPHRVALNVTVLLIVADAILLRGILKAGKYRMVAVCMLALLLVALPVKMVPGVQDIGQTYQVMKENEAYLTECGQTGVTEAKVPLVYPKTMYSAPWGLDYLSTTDPHNYPNDPMNRYFGVEILLGTE